jgi:hypothetical protein
MILLHPLISTLRNKPQVSAKRRSFLAKNKVLEQRIRAFTRYMRKNEINEQYYQDEGTRPM